MVDDSVPGRLCSRYSRAVYPCNRHRQALGFCVVTSVHYHLLAHEGSFVRTNEGNIVYYNSLKDILYVARLLISVIHTSYIE